MNDIANDRSAVLALLSGASKTTAPVKIQLNWIPKPGSPVEHDYILITQAPASVVSRIVKECAMVSLVDGGLLIPLNRS